MGGRYLITLASLSTCAEPARAGAGVLRGHGLAVCDDGVVATVSAGGTAVADWIQSGRVLHPRTVAKWTVKSSGTPSNSSTDQRTAAAPPSTTMPSKAVKQRLAHERGQPCGRGDCEVEICRSKRAEKMRAKAAAAKDRQAQSHARGEPCGHGDCAVEICRNAKSRSKSKAKSRQSVGRVGAGRPTAMAARRRRELHAKMLPCGVPNCTEPECRRLAAKKKALNSSVGRREQPDRKARKRKTASVVAPVRPMDTKPKKEPVRVRSVAKKSSLKVMASPNEAPAPTKPPRKSSPKPIAPRSTLVCRECLRSKPLSDFPNPKSRRCEACGGQARSSSVRTVSGVAPGLGRRR